MPARLGSNALLGGWWRNEKDMARQKISATQFDVLRMACTHGHLSQGCASMSDHGGRACTLRSLHRLGLLDVMNKPTEKGRAVFAAGGRMTPNAELSR